MGKCVVLTASFISIMSKLTLTLLPILCCHQSLYLTQSYLKPIISFSADFLPIFLQLPIYGLVLLPVDEHVQLPIVLLPVNEYVELRIAILVIVMLLVDNLFMFLLTYSLNLSSLLLRDLSCSLLTKLSRPLLAMYFFTLK